MPTIKIQNAILFEAPVVDQDGNIVTNLATASNIYYMIKRKKTDADIDALVTKSVGSGVTVNSPIIGTLSIQINSPDTASIVPATYYHAIQIVYTPNNKQELYLYENGKQNDTITFIQDVIKV